MTLPLVSVIVPVYNTERYLKKCVDSILNQTYSSIEIWLIDDGSTDMSPQICDTYQEEYHNVHVIHKGNEGQGIARNVALDMCSGDYISFVDSDDMIKTTMIEKMMSAIQKNNADIAICGIAVKNEFRTVDNNVFKDVKIYTSEELMLEYVTTSHIFTGPVNKLYNAKLFINLRFPNFRANEDAFIMHHLLGRCLTAVHVGECLYIQTIRQGSTEQSTFSVKNLALLDCAQDLIAYYKEKFPQLYPYVAYKRINDSAVLLQKVLTSPQGKRTYMGIYQKLEKEMIDEYQIISSVVVPEGRLRKNARYAIFHPNLFIIYSAKCRMRKTLKYRVLNILKHLR